MRRPSASLRERNAAISQCAIAASATEQMSFDRQTRSAAASTRSSEAWFSPPPCRQVGTPCWRGLADVVLDAGVPTPAQLEEGDSPLVTFSVARRGDEGGVAKTDLDVEQGELGAGMGTFLAHDHPGTLRPGRKIEALGDLGHPCPLTLLGAVVLDR